MNEISPSTELTKQQLLDYQEYLNKSSLSHLSELHVAFYVKIVPTSRDLQIAGLAFAEFEMRLAALTLH